MTDRRPDHPGRAVVGVGRRPWDDGVALTADCLRWRWPPGSRRISPSTRPPVRARSRSAAPAARLLARTEGGRPLADALDDEAACTPALAPLLALLAASERSGAPVGAA